MAATLPVGEAPRLERVRTLAGRRPLSLNLRCARVDGPEGPPLLLLWASGGIAAPTRAELTSQERKPALAEPAASEPTPAEAAPPARARFLWSLDRDGRFGAPNSVLIAALRSNAPHLGETLEALNRRLGSVENGDLVRAVSNRETFSDVSVLWPLVAGGRKARIKLSAAPVFDRGREFAGFKGFGRFVEIVEQPDPARDVLPPNSAPIGPALRETATGSMPTGEPPKMTGLAPGAEIADEALPARAGAGANRAADPAEPPRSSSKHAANEGESRPAFPDSAAVEPTELPGLADAAIPAERSSEAHSEKHEDLPATRFGGPTIPNRRESVFAWPESPANENETAAEAGLAAAPPENLAEPREKNADPSRAPTSDPDARRIRPRPDRERRGRGRRGDRSSARGCCRWLVRRTAGRRADGSARTHRRNLCPSPGSWRSVQNRADAAGSA